MASRMIDEHERAGRALTRLDMREVLLADECRKRLSNRQQQRLRRTPSSHRPEFKTGAASPIAWRDGLKPFVAREQIVERLQLALIAGAEWPSLVLPHKAPEPFAQASRLGRDIVEFPRLRLGPQALQHFGGHKACLLQPSQEAIAIGDPVNLGVDGRRDGIQKIQAERISNEDRGRTLLSHRKLISRGGAVTDS